MGNIIKTYLFIYAKAVTIKLAIAAGCVWLRLWQWSHDV